MASRADTKEIRPGGTRAGEGLVGLDARFAARRDELLMVRLNRTT
jgi:hypothetical protein